jgi:hypothetical protein
MGGSKGYTEESTMQGGQQSLLDEIMKMAGPYMQQAAGGYQQFLPGGGGGEAMKQQANQNFQQNTIPSILNAFGSGTKGSSSMNQALASGASNMNTDLSSMLSQLQLQAAQGLGNLGMGASQQALGTNTKAYMPKAPPVWQQILGPLISAGGKMGGAYLGRG